MLLMILMVKKFFTNKTLQKPDQKEFKVEKVIKRKGDILYIKWEG